MKKFLLGVGIFTFSLIGFLSYNNKYEPQVVEAETYEHNVPIEIELNIEKPKEILFEKKYVSAINGLNMRMLPNINSKVMGILQYNDEIQVYSDYIDNYWYKIKKENNDYYVSKKYLSDEKNENKVQYLGNYKITHYCSCPKCCGKWSKYKKTSSGTPLIAGKTVACNSIEAGTEIIINGHIYTVEDTGNMKDNVIDIYCNNHQEALNKGMYYADVYLK